DRRDEKRVGRLHDFREQRGLDSLQPDGGVGMPDAKVQVRQPPVGIGMPHRGYEDGHFLVTESNVWQRIEVPEEPARAIGELHLEDYQRGAGQVHGEKVGCVGHLVPPAQDQDGGEEGVRQEQLVHRPETGVFPQYFSQAASLYQDSVSARPVASGVRASQPSAAAARRVSQVHQRQRASATFSREIMPGWRVRCDHASAPRPTAYATLEGTRTTRSRRAMMRAAAAPSSLQETGWG